MKLLAFLEIFSSA